MSPTGGQSSVRPSLMVDWIGLGNVALAQGWVHTTGGLANLSALPLTGKSALLYSYTTHAQFICFLIVRFIACPSAIILCQK